MDDWTRNELIREFVRATFEHMSRCECEEFIIDELTTRFSDWNDTELLEEVEYYHPSLLRVFGINPITNNN